MNQIINAVYENGVLKPEQPLDLAEGVQVQIVVNTLGTQSDRVRAWEEFDHLCEEISVDSAGERMTREQLHERR